MQYDRQDGHLTPLPAPCVDTGMGLERIASVVQGQTSNYATDLFLDLIATTEQLCGQRYGGRFDPENVISGDPAVEQDVAFRVIADHARATAFLIAEGIYPDSEGRGYVLRRVMRRAIRYGRKLGMKDTFLWQIAGKVSELLGGVFPELAAQRGVIERLTRQEEERFGQTLESGLKLISSEIARIQAEGGDKVVAGQVVFLLHDTHGFPTDLTALIAAEQGFGVDMAGFDAAMQAQRARGKASWKKGSGDLQALTKELADEGMTTEFVGYEYDHAEAKVLAVIADGARVAQLAAGQEGLVVLDRTALYGEGGGQVGDEGALSWQDGHGHVLDTQKTATGLHLHRVRVGGGQLRAGVAVRVDVAAERRAAIRAHHSATHLLHKALRDVLGNHVKQRGSLVEAGRLRFDFSHFAALTADEIAAVEAHVNRRVVDNAPAEVEHTSMDAAVQKGAMAFFGDKYGDVVRVMKLGDSIELCGGTHVARTGDIGLVQVVSEAAVSAGVRRIEAVCHLAALAHTQAQARQLADTARRLGAPIELIGERIDRLYEQLKAAQQEADKWKHKALSGGAGGAADDSRQIGAVKALFRSVEGVDGGALRGLADQLRDQLGSGAVCLLSVQDGGKAALLVAVTKDLVAQLPAGAVMAEVAPVIGGKGGGRADLAQAGGQAPADTLPVRQAFFDAVTKRLA
jgi:alanyl-tRNA synthetase